MNSWKIALASLGAVFGLATSPLHAADQVKLMFDWLPGGLHGAWYAGNSNGCFQEQDLEVTLERGFGSVDAVTKVASGVADLGMADLGTLMLAGVRGDAAVKALFPVYNESPMAVATLSASGIETLSDLEGRNLASAPGDSAVVMLPLAMKRAGAEFEKVQRTSADASALFGLLMQGQTDAITTFVTTGRILQGIASAAGKELELIHFGVDLEIYGSVIFANSAFLKERPELVEKVIAAGKCVYEKARENPGSAVDALMAQFPEKKRENEAASTEAAIDLVFNNDTYRAHGFGWDQEKVKRTFEQSMIAQGETPTGNGESFVLH